jgi:hypothetical protein
MLKQHNIIKGLKTHGLVMDMSERRKVFILLETIKTIKLDATKTRIMSDYDLRNDYDKCVTLFKGFVRRNNVETATTKISAVGTKPPPARDKEDRYVPPAEWATITDEQKTAVQAAHQACQKKGDEGKGGGGKQGKEKGASKGKKTWDKVKKFSTKALKKMVDRKVAAIMAKPKEDDSSDDKKEVEMNDKRDSHQMRQKSAKKSGKGN